jgi:hypothetical protein
MLQRLLDSVFRLLELAKLVIAGDADGETEDGVGDAQAQDVEKPVVGLDERGHLAVGGPVQGLSGKEGVRRVVMSSWLLIRDGSQLLQSLVSWCSLETHPGAANEWILPFDSVVRIGEWFVESLGVLKHVGAVGFAVQGFQGVCACLLRLRKAEESSGQQHLLLLPSQWLDRLLSRLQGGSQGFVLRKSAGFAGSFLALARAEPRSHQTVLLSKMLHALLCMARDEGTGSLGTRVHAMNIIKALVEDAALAGTINPEVLHQVFTLAVDGFARRIGRCATRP